MNIIKNFFGHLHTINRHRRAVRKLCFKLGLYRQGLTHDLSKFSPAEFGIGIKYFQGFRSPHMLEREKLGYSSSWLHHKGRNKHHYEYWDDDININDGKNIPIKMPIRYVKEMFCDRIAATKIYKGNKFKTEDPYDFFCTTVIDPNRIHKDTAKLLETRLEMYKDKGEKETIEYIKKNYKNNQGQNY